MAELTKQLHHGIFKYGDVVRLTRAVKGSGGKRYKFVGAVSEDEASDPLYYELIEMGRGQFRSIRPEYVVKDVKASKDAQARIAAKQVSTNG